MVGGYITVRPEAAPGGAQTWNARNSMRRPQPAQALPSAWARRD